MVVYLHYGIEYYHTQLKIVKISSHLSKSFRRIIFRSNHIIDLNNYFFIQKS